MKTIYTLYICIKYSIKYNIKYSMSQLTYKIMRTYRVLVLTADNAKNIHVVYDNRTGSIKYVIGRQSLLGDVPVKHAIDRAVKESSKSKK